MKEEVAEVEIEIEMDLTKKRPTSSFLDIIFRAALELHLLVRSVARSLTLPCGLRTKD